MLRRIKEEGRYPWTSASEATHQTLTENAISRFKALVRIQLTSRNFDSQRTEALVKCRVLNQLAELGLPQSKVHLGGSCALFEYCNTAPGMAAL